MGDELKRLEGVLQQGEYNIFTNWPHGSHYETIGHFHLSEGMCDDFGCSESCRDFETLGALLAYLESLHGSH